MSKKIAFPTDDGEKISRHFGSAQYFQVVTLSDNGEATTELREKGGHGHQDHDHHHEQGHGHDHGHGHGPKFALLTDCQVLIGAGMGQPAYQKLQDLGVTVFLTAEKFINDALAKYQNGTLDNDMRRVHAHHHHDHDHHTSGKQDVTFDV